MALGRGAGGVSPHSDEARQRRLRMVLRIDAEFGRYRNVEEHRPAALIKLEL
jgi:hypothetical protein